MSEGTLIPFQIQPGFNKNTTRYNAGNQWINGDKIRFRNEGRPEKMGGWVNIPLTYFNDSSKDTLTGVVRDSRIWRALIGNIYQATASNLKVELIFDGQIYDLTPFDVLDETNTNVDISTENGEEYLIITDTGHNRNLDDFVILQDSSPSSVGGISIDGEYQVIEVIDVDNYKVSTPGKTATSTAGS